MIDDYYYPDQGFYLWKDLGNLVVSFTEFAVNTPADIIINQNIGAEELEYSNPLCLLGTSYFMLRQDYRAFDKDTRGHIFDADSVNRKMTPLEFSQTMAGARAIICSAGLTAYEALYLEKPLFLRLSAENQRRTYTKLIDKGYALPYNDENIERLSYGWIPTLKSGREVVDGFGPRRVCQAILSEWNRKSTASG